MTVAAVVIAVAALALVGRWWLRRYDAVGRERAYPYRSAGLLLAVAVALTTPTFLRHREEHRLSQVATALAGVPVTVHCETFGQTFTELNNDLGFVSLGPDGQSAHHTQIERSTCEALRRYIANHGKNPTAEEVVAVHVLTHESMHMRGQRSEAMAECEAIQRDARTARLLGASALDASALAQRYWRLVYPHMPAGYQSRDCAPGGALDEHLPDPPWQAAAQRATS